VPVLLTAEISAAHLSALGWRVRRPKCLEPGSLLPTDASTWLSWQLTMGPSDSWSGSRPMSGAAACGGTRCCWIGARWLSACNASYVSTLAQRAPCLGISIWGQRWSCGGTAPRLRSSPVGSPPVRMTWACRSSDGPEPTPGVPQRMRDPRAAPRCPPDGRQPPKARPLNVLSASAYWNPGNLHVERDAFSSSGVNSAA